MSIRIESIGLFDNKDGGPSSGTRAMIKKAAEKCLAGSAHGKEDIGLVVNVSVYKDHDFAEPALATFVQNDLKINSDKDNARGPKTLSFDVLNGAMGFLNACQLSGAMIDSGKTKAGLIVSGDMVDYVINERGSSPGFYLSGAAMLLDKTPNGVGFDSFYFKKFVEMQKTYESYISYENKKLSMTFKRNPALEKIYLNALSRGVSEFLAEKGIGLDTFDLILPPQISPEFVSSMAETLGIDKKKVIDVTRDEGDLFNASMAMAMGHVFKNRLASAGNKALIINVSSGIQVGLAIYNL